MAETLINRSWIAAIFDGRNKTYGAYELRNLYDKNINKALIIAVIIFSLFISLPLIMSLINFGPKEEEKIDNVEVTLEAPPPVDPKTPPPPPPPVLEMPKLAAAVKFLPPKVEEDEKVREEDPPTVDEMKDKQISTENREGEKTSVDVIEETPTAGVIEEPKAEEIFTVVEENPDFPGGAAARQKFIMDNIKYPKKANDASIEGRVVVGFVVNAQGEIVDPVVMKGIGGGCDEEALRVVKLMPKWKPGRQNGRNVSVRFVLPIKFTLSN